MKSKDQILLEQAYQDITEEQTTPFVERVKVKKELMAQIKPLVEKILKDEPFVLFEPSSTSHFAGYTFINIGKNKLGQIRVGNTLMQDKETGEVVGYGHLLDPLYADTTSLKVKHLEEVLALIKSYGQHNP